MLSTNRGTSTRAVEEAIFRTGVPLLKDAVALLCRQNFLVFCKVELDMEIGPHHREWAERLQSGKDVCEMAPRDHGKSAFIVRAYSLWKIKYSEWVREVLILGADQPSAVENLDKIKEILELRPTLSFLVPANKRETFYSRTEVKLTNGKVIRARGIGSPLRGRHPQLIILDDILNEDNSLDPDNRRLIRTHYNEVIVPMKDKGLKSRIGLTTERSQIVIVGTAQNKDDLYHELHKNPEYVGRKMAAVIDDEKKIVLWSDRYDYEDLMAIKRKVGSLAFSKEYLNVPISEETSLFPPSLFEACKDETLSYVTSYDGGNPVYLGADFSVPGNADGDWTVISVMERDPKEGTMTLLNYHRSRPKLVQDQTHRIELMCQLFKVQLGYLESNLFQQIYTHVLTNRTSLPVTGHHVSGTKKNSVNEGVLSFIPLLENAKIRFPYRTDADKAKTDAVISEFNGITQRRGKIGNETYHDDIVMSLWHCLCASREGAAFSASWD